MGEMTHLWVEAGLKPLPNFWYRHFARQKPPIEGVSTRIIPTNLSSSGHGRRMRRPGSLICMNACLITGKMVYLAAQAPKRSRL